MVRNGAPEHILIWLFNNLPQMKSVGGLYSITNDKTTSLTMKATPGFLLMKFNSVVCGKYPLIHKLMIVAQIHWVCVDKYLLISNFDTIR